MAGVLYRLGSGSGHRQVPQVKLMGQPMQQVCRPSPRMVTALLIVCGSACRLSMTVQQLAHLTLETLSCQTDLHKDGPELRIRLHIYMLSSAQTIWVQTRPKSYQGQKKCASLPARCRYSVASSGGSIL